MSSDSPTNSPRGPHWLLRRADQATVAWQLANTQRRMR